MAGISDRNTRKTQSPLVLLCGWLLKIFAGILSLFFVGVVVNIFSGIETNFVPKDWVDKLKKPTEWVFQNPVLVILLVTIFLLLMAIFYLVSRSSSNVTATTENLPSQSNAINTFLPSTQQTTSDPSAEKDLGRRYLQRMARETELLRLTGIPAGLVAPSVPLDDVFIPVEFFPRRLPSDYPITKDEFSRYHDLLQRGQFSEEMERVFAGTEKTWLDILKKGEKATIADLWSQLNKNTPVAVIQGYPGMGKSTLMARLTLHMARSGLGQPDPSLNIVLDKSRPIPVPLLLKDYAIELEKADVVLKDLSLINYMQIAVERLHIPGLFSFLQTALAKGRCLIMLDGLDEVSELSTRKRVKQAIETFVLDYRDTSKNSCNRFLITSRVAGYDVIAFADYLHYTIAELTPEQISDFLPRWCRASVRRGTIATTPEQEETIIREAEQMAKRLSDAVTTHQGVGQLAQNPLLLTLLAAMQQNSIELPRQRVELYTVVTKTLLENRNLAKELKPIPETQAIQRLGPIAFQMQETGNSFARQRDVKAALREIIQPDGGTPDEIEREVTSFLDRIRVRGGLFVIRTGDYFGFFHRTFQEYFAARHILNLIKLDPDTWIAALVKRARSSDELWREPFLLAVAYQSSEDETIARKIIQALLDTPQGASFAERAHDVLLAAECIVESKPLTIGAALEKLIMQRLLMVYEEAQRTRTFDICEKIERGALRWLPNLPGESYRPAPLLVLREAMINAQHVKLQYASLAFLTIIAQQLIDSPPVVFEMLVPPLLALTGLPASGKFRSDSDVPVSSDLNTVDLALAALSFLGQPGPAGQLLLFVRQHFKDHPKQLRLLARYSLESKTLITPTVVPVPEENYQRYEAAIGQWMTLRDEYQVQRIIERDIDRCLAMHEALLSSATEASYPTAMHLINMLQEAIEHLDRPWPEVWQEYLLKQLSSEGYVHYQTVALLWTMLFPGKRELKVLTDLILQHYNGTQTTLQRNAQRFVASLSNNLRDSGDLIGLEFLEGLRDLGDLRDFLLTREVMEQAKKAIPSVDPIQYSDLLTILMGRVPQIQEADEVGTAIEGELQQIVDVANTVIASTNGNEDVLENALDILRYLSARSVVEVNIIRQTAENATNIRVHTACSYALSRTRSKTPDVWAAILACRQSPVQVIRDAAERVLKRDK